MHFRSSPIAGIQNKYPKTVLCKKQAAYHRVRGRLLDLTPLLLGDQSVATTRHVLARTLQKNTKKNGRHGTLNMQLVYVNK